MYDVLNKTDFVGNITISQDKQTNQKTLSLFNIFLHICGMEIAKTNTTEDTKHTKPLHSSALLVPLSVQKRRLMRIKLRNEDGECRRHLDVRGRRRHHAYARSGPTPRYTAGHGYRAQECQLALEGVSSGFVEPATREEGRKGGGGGLSCH